MLMIVLVSGIAVFSIQVVNGQEDLPAIVKKIGPSVVMVMIYDDEGKTIRQGSGFFINKRGDVITNGHVLQGAFRAEVRPSSGEMYPVEKVLAESKEGDLVYVSVGIPSKIARPIPLSKSLPTVGERVLVIGSPLGLEQTVSDGIVSAIREVPAFGQVIQITAPISPGSSGSPVVNLRGEVIGAATFQMIKGQNLNFAIPTAKIAGLIPGEGQTLAEWEERITYKIGALLALSGPYARLGFSQIKMIKSIQDYVNAQSGINRHLLRIVDLDKVTMLPNGYELPRDCVSDTEGNPTKAASNVRKMIRRDNVLGVIGPTLSKTTMDVIPIVENENVPLISFGKSEKITKPARKWVFSAWNLNVSDILPRHDLNNALFLRRQRSIVDVYGASAFNGMLLVINALQVAGPDRKEICNYLEKIAR